MCRFIESIKIINGEAKLLDLHQKRMHQSVLTKFNLKAPDLRLILNTVEIPSNGIFKCRIIYDSIIRKLEFIPYKKREIESLKVVIDNDINYVFKFENRDKLNKLFSKRKNCDDIIIVKNNQITDSSYSNLVFFDGINWLTPVNPLLNGIQRQFLLSKKLIFETKITVKNIKYYQKIGLINAMLDLESMPVISIENVKF